jgi:hypothetical protein
MTTDALTCANSNATSGTPATKHKIAQALRYDNLARVLVDLEKRAHVPTQRAHVPTQPKRHGKASTDPVEIAELRAHVANLQAENERVITSISDDLDELAYRIAELEARAQWPLWRRAFGYAGDRPELAPRARRKLTERVRSIFFGSGGRETPIHVA